MENQTIYEKLSAPFLIPGADGKIYPAIKWKMQTNGGVCVPYIDSRQVMERLNEVLGVDGWKDTLIETSGKYIICELTCNINGTEITHSDVGTETSIQGEKGQVSDALKRVAVKFGIGAYIYKIEPVKLVTKQVGNKHFAVTQKGVVLSTGDMLSSYINQMNPLRVKLGEINAALSEAKRKECNDSFVKIWNALNE